MNVDKLLELGTFDNELYEELLREACSIRQDKWGSVVTYSRKVFVPLTNMCRDECGYCTFVKHPDSPEAKLMTPSEVMKSLRAAEAMHCKEALFSLGEKPERRYPQAASMLSNLGYKSMTDYLYDACEMTLQETSLIPHVNAGTLTEDEIVKLKQVSGSMGMMLESLSMNLMKVGGPHYRCPDKAPKPRLQTIRNAGKHQVPFTTGLLIGIGESWRDRVEALRAINELHLEYGHIQEVIIQNFKAKPGIAMENSPEPDDWEMMTTLAIARIILDPSISLQAPPNLSDKHINYLDAGINDWGGISPVTRDFINPERAWPNLGQLELKTAEKNLLLQERLTVYPEYLKEYLEKNKFIDSKVAQRLMPQVRGDGLALVQVF